MELIEFTGGPNTECDECPVYDYDDLTDYYWPALMGGVLKYSNSTLVDYVGYSAGGGVGIKSYEKYYPTGKQNAGKFINEAGQWESFDLPSDSVDHMALIAPMGSFNAIVPSPIEFCLQLHGDKVNNLIEGKPHVSFNDVARALAVVSGTQAAINIPGENGKDVICATIAAIVWDPQDSSKIAFNAWSNLTNDIIQNSNDPELGLSDIGDFMVIKGDAPILPFSDGVIPDGDLDEMYDNTNQDNEKYLARVDYAHQGLYNKNPVYNPLISKFINNKPFSQQEINNYLEEYVITA